MTEMSFVTSYKGKYTTEKIRVNFRTRILRYVEEKKLETYFADSRNRHSEKLNFKTEFFKSLSSGKKFAWENCGGNVSNTQVLVDFLAHMYNEGTAESALGNKFDMYTRELSREQQNIFGERFIRICTFALTPNRSDIELIRIISDSGTNIKYMFDLQLSGRSLSEELRTFRQAMVFPLSDAAAFCFRDGLFPANKYPSGYKRIAKLVLGEWEHAISLYCFRGFGPPEVCKIILSFW